MRYKEGVDKQQLTLLPASLDDYVPEDHMCRVIYAFSERLDMAGLGYKYGECKRTGCRPYDPRWNILLGQSKRCGDINNFCAAQKQKSPLKRRWPIWYIIYDGLSTFSQEIG